jgi:putative transposase
MMAIATVAEEDARRPSSAHPSPLRKQFFDSIPGLILQKLFADSAYQGPLFNSNLVKILSFLQTEILRRSHQAKGFVVLRERWVVDHTIARLNRCHRHAKDFESLNCNALAFFRLAFVRLMLRKLCNP